jgi:hypothetical protein
VSGSDDLPGSFFGWLAGLVRKAASDSVARSRAYSDHHGHAVSRADEGTEAAPFGECHAKSTHPPARSASLPRGPSTRIAQW